jgi:hypothetical protein
VRTEVNLLSLIDAFFVVLFLILISSNFAVLFVVVLVRVRLQLREREGDLEYTDTPAVPTQAYVLRIRPSGLASMPRLVLSEVLHNWLTSRVELNLSAERNDQIAAMTLASLSWGQISKAVTVSSDWDVRCFRGGELHLVRRNVAPKKYKAQGKLTKMENRERMRVEKLTQQDANGTEQNA